MLVGKRLPVQHVSTVLPTDADGVWQAMRAYRIILISDSTGETVTAAAEAVASQFPDMKLETTLHPFVRTTKRVRESLADVEVADLVIFTTMNPAISALVGDTCDYAGVPMVALLDPVLQAFENLDGRQPSGKPGRQYTVDRDYLERVSAIDYAIRHDDGLSGEYLRQADVILVGVSRTSKTPTCIYLAYQGIRAANVPLVPDQDVPDSFIAAMDAGVPVVGLIASPTRLSQVRRHRLKALGNPARVDYAEIREIQEELTSARLFFEKYRLPVIDVTRRSIEETAAAVRGILVERGAK